MNVQTNTFNPAAQAAYGFSMNGERQNLAAPTSDVVRIRKYPNRRLYDTQRSCHLTHEGVLSIIADGRTVQVIDSRSGTDITNIVLMQILIERDPARLKALPSNLLQAAMRTDTPNLKGLAEAALAAWQASGTAPIEAKKPDATNAPHAQAEAIRARSTIIEAAPPAKAPVSGWAAAPQRPKARPKHINAS